MHIERRMLEKLGLNSNFDMTIGYQFIDRVMYSHNLATHHIYSYTLNAV